MKKNLILLLAGFVCGLQFMIFAQGKEPGTGKVMAARVKADNARIFSMEADTSDVTFPYGLPKGTLVFLRAKGESFKGTGTHFYKIGIPGGVIGYVHSRYISQKGPGIGEVTATRVFLRIDPSSQKYPVATLKKGTKVRLLEMVKKWWKVIAPEDVSVWIREKDIEVAGPASSFSSELSKERNSRLALWRKLVEKQEKEKELALKKKKMEGFLAKVENALEAEEAKPDPTQADVEKVRKLIQDFEKKWDEKTRTEAGVNVKVAVLKRELGNLEILKESLIKKKKAEEELAKMGKPRHGVEKKVEEFWKGGFVGYIGRLSDPPYITPYVIQKGQQIICYVKSRDGRYRLDDYLGCHVVVRGSKKYLPSLGKKPLVIVSRLQVLFPPRLPN